MKKLLPTLKALADLIVYIFLFLFFLGSLGPNFKVIGLIGTGIGIVVNLIYIIKHIVKKS